MAGRKLSYRELFLRYLDLDPFTADCRTLSIAAGYHGVNDIELDQKQWLDLLISHVIQPALPEERLTFIHDFPVDQAALARIRPDTLPVAERFELYLGRIELANGYQELTDSVEQQRRFDKENAQRKEQGKPLYKTDHHVISALGHGLPECAGVALGVDRLLMAICDADSLSDIMAFPFSHA